MFEYVITFGAIAVGTIVVTAATCFYIRNGEIRIEKASTVVTEDGVYNAQPPESKCQCPPDCDGEGSDPNCTCGDCECVVVNRCGSTCHGTDCDSDSDDSDSDTDE